MICELDIHDREYIENNPRGQLEGVFDQWREKLFGRDDLFNARQVEEAEKARAERAEKEHPMATVAGKATVELIKSAAGKAFPLEDVLPLAGKAGQAIVKMLDAMPSTVRSVAEEAILSAPEAFLEGAYEGKSMEEILKDVAVNTFEGFATKTMAERLLGNKYDWIAEAGLKMLAQQYRDDILKMPKQWITEVEKTVQKYFPGIPSEYLLQVSGAFRDKISKLTESPEFQRMDEQGQQMYLNNTLNNVLQQFWKYYNREKG